MSLNTNFPAQKGTCLRVLAAESARAFGGSGLREVRGREAIERVVTAMWDRDRTYVAEPRRVLQSGDTALSLGWGINVVRRDHEGAWRFAIALIDPSD